MSVFVGIDVSKEHLDWAAHDSSSSGRVTNDEPGLADLIARLQALGPERIVLEATGGLEVAVLAALSIPGMPVAVVNPRQVRDYAKATGRLARALRPSRHREATSTRCASRPPRGPSPRSFPGARPERG